MTETTDTTVETNEKDCRVQVQQGRCPARYQNKNRFDNSNGPYLATPASIAAFNSGEKPEYIVDSFLS